MGNSHDPSLGPFGVTAAAQRFALFHFAVIWCPHISGQHYAKKALEKVFVRFTDTRLI